MNYVGIDIGSTASKVYVIVEAPEGTREFYHVLPTGWNSKETAAGIRSYLNEQGVDVSDENTVTVATGYGRVAVEYADYVITEITCHGRGGRELFGGDCCIIDVGGQDTKVIVMNQGMVSDFLMNDKCSAGTGKFLEVMANRLGVTLEELFALAEQGKKIPISSLCTVFAESEIISYIGGGEPRENIAAGVVDSVVNKVTQLAQKRCSGDRVILTGGLSFSRYFTEQLGQKMGVSIKPREMGRYAGAYGAALIAREKTERKRR
ncbi:MAG: acyl-CoA dehydratase activase [Lachnospiraceae bacterium]|nr:acyl-CoA dehydratase activase [Lachnospiraceae bacterium]